jgi:hypothetical protein
MTGRALVTHYKREFPRSTAERHYSMTMVKELSDFCPNPLPM